MAYGCQRSFDAGTLLSFLYTQLVYRARPFFASTTFTYTPYGEKGSSKGQFRKAINYYASLTAVT